MDENRQWARKISQHDFEIGFRQRFPWCDVLPDRVEWAYGKDPQYNGIDPPTGEFEPDTGAEAEGVKEETKEIKLVPQRIKKEDGYPCRACGKRFDFAIARAGHERKCKVGGSIDMSK